jgi:dTMP kinase
MEELVMSENGRSRGTINRKYLEKVLSGGYYGLNGHKGRLIVIDGVDGSGKETQTKRLEERLLANGEDVIRISFPNYVSDSSTLVRMYLKGIYQNDAGEQPSIDHLMRISSFYAVDRASTFMRPFHNGPSLFERYNNGAIIIADRYTTSNIIHQCSNLIMRHEQGYLHVTDDTLNKIKELYNKIEDLEYRILGLPRPNQVIFLSVSVETSLSNLMKRYAGGDSPQHITETKEHLEKAVLWTKYLCRRFGYTNIQCDDDSLKSSTMRSIEDIHDDIYKKIQI